MYQDAAGHWGSNIYCYGLFLRIELERMSLPLKESLAGMMSKDEKNRLSRQARHDPALLQELMEYFLHGGPRVCQNAAWAISYVGEKQPELLNDHLAVMAEVLSNSNDDWIKRNILRVFQYVDIPEPLWGIVAERSLELLANGREAVAIRVFAMTVLLHIVYKVPELKNELRVIVEDQMPYGSAGFQSRGRKVLKSLDRIPDV